MRLLQRYILWELLKVFSILLSILTVLLVFVGIFREVSESGLGPQQALQILPFIVPSLMPFTVPATLLLTVCLVYGRIAGDQEVTAAKAAGVHVLSLLAPALLLGMSLSVASLLLTDQVIPWAVANIQQIVTEAMEDIFLDILRTKHQVVDPGHGISIMVMDVEGRTLIRPTFRYSRPGGTPVIIQARTAEMTFDLDRREVIVDLRQGHLDMGNGRTVIFEHEERRFPLPKELQGVRARDFSIVQLRDKMVVDRRRLRDHLRNKDLQAAFALSLGEFSTLEQTSFYWDAVEKPANDDLRKMETEIHMRPAMACSCFFFVLIGGPFSIMQARRQFLTSFIICFVPILTVYYPLVLGMMNLCKTGQADPLWAMWIANAVLLSAGLLILRKVVRH